MAVQSGGGAATLSGATYQSKVAAYFIVCLLCDFELNPLNIRPSAISFETANAVDDINIKVPPNLTAYVQVKRILSFSLDENGELYSVLDQFVRQSLADSHIHSLALVTTSDSSKRITVTLPAIVAALLSGSEADFRRDQNKSLVRDLDLLVAALDDIHRKACGERLERDRATALLQKIRICLLDLAIGTPLEQAAYLLLNAKGCRSPSLLWGKIVADCASFSASRRTLSAEFLLNQYSEFFASELPQPARDNASSKKLFEIITSGDIPTGREVVVGYIRGDTPAKKTLENLTSVKITDDNICIFDFYRFDEKCEERIKFSDGSCTLQDGLAVKLLRRAATFTGLDRFIDRHKDKFSQSDVLIFESNISEDLEKGKCAIARRALLSASMSNKGASLECIHCSKPISSNDVDYIEYIDQSGPKVGLSHDTCTKPDDRVIGTIYSEFFKKYDFLRNFDAVRWFMNIPRGQGGYTALQLAAGRAAKMTWSGRSPRASTGTYVVELELADGTSEFSYHRGQLDRFSKLKADRFCADLNRHISEQRGRADPLCLSQDSMQFGTQSTILMITGATEKLRPIVKAHVRKYRSTMARRYDNSDNWFTPVAYLRSLPDETPVGIGGAIFLITQPLLLDRFILNWRECGLELSDYEVPIFANDEEFDQFAREQFGDGRNFMIDPLFHIEADVMQLIKGTPLLSMSQVEAAAKLRDQSGP